MVDLLKVLKQGIQDAISRNDKIARDLLRTLVGDIENKKISSKGEFTNDQIIALIKKYDQNVDEMLKFVTSDVMRNSLQEEKEVLSWFLPVQFSESEIKLRMKSSGFKKMGELMKYMKEMYPGMYDGKTASMIAKQVEEESNIKMSYEEFVKGITIDPEIVEMYESFGKSIEELKQQSYEDYLKN